MSVRNSEYDRVPNDTYVTPDWVWAALHAAEPWAREAWDCCPANADFDFLTCHTVAALGIATNPPYGRMAEHVVRKALRLTRPAASAVAMLLPHSWVCAKGRVDLFDPPFERMWILTKRIRWANLEQKTAGPSTNHAWYIWNWRYEGPAKMGWL